MLTAVHSPDQTPSVSIDHFQVMNQTVRYQERPFRRSRVSRSKIRVEDRSPGDLVDSEPLIVTDARSSIVQQDHTIMHQALHRRETHRRGEFHVTRQGLLYRVPAISAVLYSRTSSCDALDDASGPHPQKFLSIACSTPCWSVGITISFRPEPSLGA